MPAYPNYFPVTYQNPYYNQYQQPVNAQPQQPQMQQVQQQPIQSVSQQFQAPQSNGQGVNWVQGEAGAKSWLIAPNTTVLLMDSEADVFYLKSADASGVPLPLRIFDYTERPSEARKPTVDASKDKSIDYVTKDDLKSNLATLKGQIKDEITEMFSGAFNTKAKKKESSNE